jgi:sulfur-carrier protein
MSVTVKFFASIREKLGKSEETLDFQQPLSASEVWEKATHGPLPPNTMVAVNQEYADPGHLVRDGDEVAFFPPVTGG